MSAQSRLSVNAVTLGDFDAPFRISAFVKELFAGFSLVRPPLPHSLPLTNMSLAESEKR